MTGGRQSLRTFFALWPDAAVRAELAQRATWAAKACGGRATPSPLLHLTLVFIGATPRERMPALVALMDAIELPPFVLALDHGGWWRHNGVVWAGARAVPEPLLDLQHALARGAERLGFSLDVRPYAPHLTLARDAGRSPPSTASPSCGWQVRSFVLVSSKPAPAGPRYDILHERALVAADPIFAAPAADESATTASATTASASASNIAAGHAAAGAEIQFRASAQKEFP